ncbi:NAD-dependent DNA ligase [Kaistia algarum]|uniref:BRCT domain-containing protein n=1 Tax=Kaistia algarum TaxID=2083279 RepID=UPI000CE89189|nr:BRCT domain-containing protein [Kaistia algarum]MCX5515520.1 BRCT domain-containing protein [Kaistia algarum]PPE81078.1 NAD-dependent DNA ligase [Kaistia algarum]
MDDAFLNRVGNDRISNRQVNELIGISRGLVADGIVNQAEAEFLQRWLAANFIAGDQPLIRDLYNLVAGFLQDGVLDDEERATLFDTLREFTAEQFELGELLKPTTLPLCRPAPKLVFYGKQYCFTGTFVYGQRKACEEAVLERGADVGSLTQGTDVLVIGSYVTDSWKHSSFGTKILRAAEWRSKGRPISIVSEDHWRQHL